MALQTDLVGVGMPTEQALRLGNQPATLTCTGTTQATAKAITTKMMILSAASSQTGAILPGTSSGVVYFLNNTGSTTAIVYAPVGGTLGASTTAGINLPQNKAMVAWSTSALNFAYVILA